LSFPEAAAIASQHPAQRLAGFNQMGWLADTASRHRERPPFRWHRYGKPERRGAALSPKQPAGPPPSERRAAARGRPPTGPAGSAGTAEGAAASGAASEATGGDGAAAADAPMSDGHSEETQLPSPHVLFFLRTRIMHVNVHKLILFPPFRYVCPPRSPRRNRSRRRNSRCLRT
jgi:hypothetical protein